MTYFKWDVGPDQAGLSLQLFIQRQLGSSYSVKSIKRFIESACCQVNGRIERFASVKVKVRDRITFQLLKERLQTTSSIQWDPERLLYEDEDLLVYNKPAGINSDSNGIEALVRQHAKEARLVHRLDRETTGVLLFAKNQKTLSDLIEQFRALLVQKVYLTLVEGCPIQSKGLIHNWLGIHKRFSGQTLWGVVPKHKGLEAKTAWRLLSKGREASLLACYPQTGRTHQIRVHLSAMGHPIISDYQYGAGRVRCGAARYILHAYQLTCKHPVTHKRLTFTAPVPEDFISCCSQLCCNLTGWCDTKSI